MSSFTITQDDYRYGNPDDESTLLGRINALLRSEGFDPGLVSQQDFTFIKMEQGGWRLNFLCAIPDETEEEMKARKGVVRRGAMCFHDDPEATPHIAKSLQTLTVDSLEGLL